MVYRVQVDSPNSRKFCQCCTFPGFEFLGFINSSMSTMGVKVEGRVALLFSVHRADEDGRAIICIQSGWQRGMWLAFRLTTLHRILIRAALLRRRNLRLARSVAQTTGCIDHFAPKENRRCDETSKWPFLERNSMFVSYVKELLLKLLKLLMQENDDLYVSGTLVIPTCSSPHTAGASRMISAQVHLLVQQLLRTKSLHALRRRRWPLFRLCLCG
jgi:hypothetical protein